MSDLGLTPDELKRQYNEKTRTEARTFETQGVSRQAALDYLETPEGRLYRQRLIEGAPDKPVSEIRRWAINQITSGRELPRMETLTEPLVKIVPQGQRPSPHSPYWTREADLDAAIKEGQNLSHRFGLPVASESLQYDVYRITPKRPTEVFVNTVAPTSELDGQVTKPGGARQVLIPNRQLYEPHAFIRTVDNRLHIPAKGHGIRPTVKAAGALGTAYGAYDAKHQVDAAIDTARSSREQWVRGAEEVANQTVRTVVTGSAATVGSIPGAAGGALTSPVTGPLGPMAGGLLTGGAAAAGAENLYEDSRLQQWSKTLGREVGQMGYDHVSREGRLLRQVNGLQEDLLNTTDPIERGRLQTRLDAASAAFGQEAERNSRTFEARAEIDQAWERNHARYPQIDKDDVNDALARHIGAGKPPADAVRGAFSDAVHERYPRSLPHEPLENYRALGDAQLAQKHQQYVGEVAQGRRDVMVLAASKDSHNTVDQGWPQALAQQHQAERVQAGMNGLWRDIGHLGAIREVYRERGLRPPELPAELRTREDPAAPTRSGRSALTPEQQRHHALAREQLAPGLTAQEHGPEHVDRVCAAAVSHVQRHAHRGQVRAFHLSKDGQQIAVVQEHAPIGEFSVHHALAQTRDWHLAQAHEMAHDLAQEAAREAVQTQAGAPSGPTPTRASVWA